ncbi:hypothetical protein [Veronia pacifica]|uniref:Uncharacterized protein n=1 Tax=Veronia pacifica TaxID=1080227 RepID=A0A1C3ELD8_9GAMM|nr:hypothetical protein [Veronia pacifica]ODA34035.1 hypothetical protein A8L45_08300 [Veronia pacifica]
MSSNDEPDFTNPVLRRVYGSANRSYNLLIECEIEEAKEKKLEEERKKQQENFEKIMDKLLISQTLDFVSNLITRAKNKVDF